MRRLLTFRDERALYWLLDSQGGFLNPHGDEFVARVGCSEEQAVRDLFARSTYKLGEVRGRYRGSMTSNVMPLVPEDFWLEAVGDGIRTWQRDGAFFRFSPYTLADIRTVSRCGSVESTFSLRGTSVVVRLSMDYHGISYIGLPPEYDGRVLKLVDELQLPVLAQSADLERYIDRNGTIVA